MILCRWSLMHFSVSYLQISIKSHEATFSQIQAVISLWFPSFCIIIIFFILVDKWPTSVLYGLYDIYRGEICGSLQIRVINPDQRWTPEFRSSSWRQQIPVWLAWFLEIRRTCWIWVLSSDWSRRTWIP